MVQLSLMMTEAPQDATEQRWFSADGCVVFDAGHTEVFVGGTLVGSFTARDEVQRNLLLVHLAQDRRIKKETLAWAFKLSVQQVWVVRCRVRLHGVDALFGRPGRGRKPAVTDELTKTVLKAFDAGKQVGEVHAALQRGKVKAHRVSYRSVCRVRAQWLAAQAPAPATAAGCEAPAEGQAERGEVAGPSDDSPRTASGPALPARVVGEFGAEEDDGTEVLEARPLRGGHDIQHVGGWLLLSMVHALGLHAAVAQGWGAAGQWARRLRVALDAVVLSLGLGQRCVEGVRRLRTPSAAVLLRADGAPTASWTRRVLKRYLEVGGGGGSDGSSSGGGSGGGDGSDVPSGRGQRAQMRMMQVYLQRASRDAQEPAVFYVDNHMRPYTGKYTVRKGWRMQDKRARPGVTDYYVHDEDGRAVFRYSASSHDSLSRWLSPVTQRLREALGPGQRILLAFDRAGAFPEPLSSLRDAGFEFVTYERRPYPLLCRPAFTEQLVVEDGEVIGVHESRRKNLGKGRGRVRRIALHMADGRQVNLLAVSEAPVRRLVEVMLGRWVQENGFKHGNERWGINQLDGRKREPYPPETVIPNPARRRLDHAMRLARDQEGRARNTLSRLAADDPKRARYEQELAQAQLDQDLYFVFRAITPHHAPLSETELAGKLERHKGDYKALVDTIRIACANAESELALLLAPHLRRPREAKKALANVFAAPGAVRVNATSVTVTLEPAGTPNERQAFGALFEQVNRLGLTLPGDPDARRLRFQLQL